MRDPPTRFLVGLVPRHHERELDPSTTASRRRHSSHLLQELRLPPVQTVEAHGVGNVVHEHGGVGASVKRHPQTLEPLLTGRVPDLQRDQVPLSKGVGYDHFFRDKVGPDRGLVLSRELARAEPVEERRLSDAETSNTGVNTSSSEFGERS
jgi:hypothetical protein